MRLVNEILGEVSYLRDRQGKSANAVLLADELEPELALNTENIRLMSLGYLERFLLKMDHELGDTSEAEELEIQRWSEG